MTSLFTNLIVFAMAAFQKYLLFGGIALLVIAIIAKVLQKK